MDCRGCDKRQPRLVPGLGTTRRLWLGCRTQWRAGLGPLGLDYNAVQVAAGWLGIRIDERIFGHLMWLEHWTLEASRREQETEQRKARMR